MNTPGKVVVVTSGKRGVLAGGRSAVFNNEGMCDACCIVFTQLWSFTDIGFIDGGQDGAFRAYDHPGDVPASPWLVLNRGLGLRLDWEDDINCRSHNPYTQSATATCEITVPRAMIMTVNWSGMGETQDPGYELMSLHVNGNLVGSAHAPGGGLGCDGGMGPVVSDPPPPQEVLLAAGPHTLHAAGRGARGIRPPAPGRGPLVRGGGRVAGVAGAARRDTERAGPVSGERGDAGLEGVGIDVIGVARSRD